ncbi:MAG TPA: RDD family protein [Vicinamibacterales bacterium]|nr:RDD family protein [Vicinamibacterales bacterium]
MKSRVLLSVLILTSLATAVSAQTPSRRRGDPAVPLKDPTSPTTQQRVSDQKTLTPEELRAAEERLRWERAFDRDYYSRRYYWRPVLRVGQDYALRAGETVRSVTVAFGSARIEGRVEGDLVVLFGPVTIGQSAVVEGSFVVIGGTADVQSGAMVRDEVMAIGAQLDVPDGFIFGGEHIVVGTRAMGRWMESVVPWITYGLLWGRPIVASIGWVWSVVAMFLLIYLLINLVAHEPVSSTAGMLATRPYSSFMTGLLVLLLAGPVSALLAVSIIGIAVIPFALAALVVAGFVGRVGVLRWLGHTVMPGDEPNSRVQGLRAFAMGFVLVTLIYMVPVLGIVAWALFGVLGVGAAVLAFHAAWRREHPKVEKAPRAPKTVHVPPPPPEPLPSGGYAYSAPAAPAFAQATAFGSGPATFAGPEVPGSDWHPPLEPAAAFATGGGVAAATLHSGSNAELALFPRAAFLDRAAAFVIDVVLVLFVVQLLERPTRYGYGNDDLMFPMLLAYFVAFWAWKGTTIGGIVVNLRVVKVGGGDLSFLEALVRGLTSVLSFGALGIGVLWILRNDLVASDGRPARQAWHDLAAGTYVVKVPKGYPLP